MPSFFDWITVYPRPCRHSKESSSARSSKSNSMPNSSSTTFIKVIAAIESQEATVAVDALAICSTGRSENTTSKHFVSRWRVSSMSFCSPHFAHLMIQRRAFCLEL